jgi:hypothetical protein
MHQFIKRMILRNSVNAALQRAGVYDCGADVQLKREFKEKAKVWLVAFGNRYSREKASEKNWCNEIESLAKTLTEEFGNYLTGKRLRIGVSQKMISLYLKYLWLCGEGDKKPLFAVLDRKIMKLAGVTNPPNWTELDDIKEYERIVFEIDTFAKSKNYSDGAEWEAEEWNDEVDDDDSSKL